MNSPNPTRQFIVKFWRQPYKAELFIHKKPTGAGWAICTHPHNSFPPYTHLVSRGKMEKRNPLGFYARLCSWLGQVGVYFQNTPPFRHHGH